MPDGALMEDYIAYPEWIDRDIILDEFGRYRIENGVHPHCPPGMMMNYMFYPMGPEFGVMLFNPLWTNKDFVSFIGSNTYAVDPCKIRENMLKSIALDESGRLYRSQIMFLEANESNKLIKELIFASDISFVVKDLDALYQPLSELIVDRPDHPRINQMKRLLDTIKASNC